MFIRLCVMMLLLCAPQAAFAMANLPSQEVANVLVGKPAPEFKLGNTAGVTQTLTQARDGKRSVMIFWATWCPNCREELDALKGRLDQIKKDGVLILLVNAGETKEEASSYLKRQKIPLESLVDDDNTVSGQYSVVGIPTLIFMDEKGVIRAVEHRFPADYNSKFN
ncbi:MAG: TlpA family protein disulfide reductase [Candidatus Omnitrophica bacterium]|nr:TlpA family protein disulfide reductase [Candidatus Omnitrophota bacterium]